MTSSKNGMLYHLQCITVFYSVKLQYVLPSYYTIMQPMNGLDTKRLAHQEEDLMIIHGNFED